MPKSRIPSPARSQGVISTPRRHKSRGSRSVCSPAPSNASGRLTSVIDQFNKLDSFVLSPMTTRRSVLTDNTDIEEPRRKSWWKNLNENSQDIMEVLDDNKAVPDSNNVVEDIVDIEVLSQENKHISLDLPESSDNESIHSIVLSQHKLFTQKENKQQKKFGQLVGTRETLAKLHKTNNTLHEKTVTVTKKELFQGTKRSKPVFPLLNISPNKTTADKTKENVATEPKVPVRNIFGNKPANKRKNIFADFIVSESEDEIPEIQVKVFGFQKRVEQRRISSVSKARDPSPTSSITTDMELDEWKHLPSSTLVENQLDEMITHTPVKRARLSKISDVKESEVGSTTNTDKTMQSNKSSSSKSRTSQRLKDSSITNNTSVNKTKQSDKSAITRTSPRTRNTNEVEIQEEKNKSNQGNINESISSKSRTSLRTKDANRSKRPEDKADITVVENEPNNQKVQDPKDNIEDKNIVVLNQKDKSTIEDEAQVDAANRTKQSNKSTLSKTRTSPRLKDSSITNTSVNKTKQSDKSVSAIAETRTSPRNKTTNENEIQKEKVENKNNQKSLNKSKNQVKVAQVVELEGNTDDNKKASDTENKDRLSGYQDLPNDIEDVNEDQQNQSYADQELEVEQSKDVNEDEEGEEEQQANESQETEAEKTDEENEDHTASLIYDDSESEREETNKTVEDNEANVSQEDNNESNKNQQETSTEANVSKEIENRDNKRQETSGVGNAEDNEVNTREANVSQKDNESHEMEHDSEDDEIDEMVGDNNKENDEANVSHKVNESRKMEHESDEDKNDEAGGDNNEANVSHKVDESQEMEHESDEDENDKAVGDNDEGNDEANVSHKVDDSQQIEHESDEDANDKAVGDNNEGNDEANVSHKVDESQEMEHESDEDEKSQEVEHESDEDEKSQEVEHESEEDENANESEEVENTDNKSQDITDNDNEDNEANVDESQEVQDESEEEENDENEINDSPNESQEIEQSNESPNITHDTTGRNRKKIKSPEVILHDKTNLQNSFTAKGRNTSVRKSKSMYQALNIRPSLAPPRDSLGLSERDSSAEGSGWDSHRTTRKTLRQTFGKDFTPRKSLRALVMEKSAKRQTEHMETLHSETVKFPQANSTEYPEDSNREDIPIESDHEVSRNTRLTTLEAYLEKIKQKNQENKFKMDEAIRNSLKAPSSQDVLNLFKVPTRPPPRKLKPASNKPKKPTKYTELFGELPPEVIEDMKYKPPKRYQPPNASWVTKRLYKFLESKLEPNYDYKARVRAEKLVETIYAFSKEVLRHRHAVAPPDAVDVLKHELARLNVVKTHFEFYEFFHEFMPRELRIKVVPDVVNKIPLPRHGVFADIIRGNTVQG